MGGKFRVGVFVNMSACACVCVYEFLCLRCVFCVCVMCVYALPPTANADAIL